MATTNPPGLQQSPQQPIPEVPPQPKKRSPLRLIGIILLGIAILLFFYATIAYIALINGGNARVQEAQAELSREIATQLELANGELAQGQLNLVEHRLEWLQEQAPDRPEVIALQATADAWQAPVSAQQPTAVATAVTAAAAIDTATPIPPTVQPTATQDEPNTPVPADASLRLIALQQLLEDELWEDAIREITVFQLDEPAYERPTTDKMLFDAYIKAGIQLTNGDHVSRGISYIEQAEKLGSLTEEATSQLYYARLYLTAVSYSGVRWQVTIPSLLELCNFVPAFHDSCDMLYEARLSFGDQLVQSGDFCPAEEQYQAALDYQPSQDINRKFFDAQAGCRRATATPKPSGVWTPTPVADQ